MKGLRQRWREYRLKKGHGYVERTKSGDVKIHAPTAVGTVERRLTEIEEVLKGVTELQESTKRDVKITITLSSVGIAISIIGIVLQYFKIL